MPKSTMSIQGSTQKLCQEGLDFRGYGGAMDHEGKGGFEEVSHHFAVKLVGDFVVVGGVQRNPQVRQRGGQDGGAIR